MKKSLWSITVGGGYGTFLVRATEKGAEEMRCHKSRWEHAVAHKALIPSEEEVTAIDKFEPYYWPMVLDDDGTSPGPHIPREEANPYVE